MGKIEELIEKYERIISINNKVMSSVDSKEALGENRTAFNVIDDLKQLKSSLPTQQDKVVVPQCVDKFLSVGNKSQKLACLVSCKYSILTCDMAEGELKQWLREVSMDDLLSLANGYTVEKEQLYYISLPMNGKSAMYCNDGSRGFFSRTYTPKKLTEKEIKAIDKRYWAFVVPVEEDE